MKVALLLAKTVLAPLGPLELKWDKNCLITSLEQRYIGGGNRDNAPTGCK